MDVVKARDKVRDLAVGGGGSIENGGAEFALGELLTEIGHYIFEFAGVAAMEDDVEAVAGELSGETFANTIASSGHERPRLFAVVVPREGGGAEVEIDEAGEAEKEEDYGGDTNAHGNNECNSHGTLCSYLRPAFESALSTGRVFKWYSRLRGKVMFAERGQDNLR